jgi:hypothetical protein
MIDYGEIIMGVSILAWFLFLAWIGYDPKDKK